MRYEQAVKGADDIAIIDVSIKPITDEQGDVILLISKERASSHGFQDIGTSTFCHLLY